MKTGGYGCLIFDENSKFNKNTTPGAQHSGVVVRFFIENSMLKRHNCVKNTLIVTYPCIDSTLDTSQLVQV